MTHCRVDEDTLEEISRVQDFFELKGSSKTQNEVVKEGLELIKRNYKIPERRNKEITEVDLIRMRNILRKRGIEFKSWVLKN